MKLFLTDVDGTLLKTGGALHVDVIEAARRFVHAGGYFGLSTGRAFSAVSALVPQLPINAPCILCSGALVYDFNPQCAVSISPMERGVLPLLRVVLTRFPTVSITVFTENSIGTLRVNERLLAHGVYEDRTAPMIALPDIDKPIKILFTCDDVATLELIGREFVDPEQFSYHAASRHFYELTRYGINKGTAAGALCASLGAGGKCHLYTAGDAASDLTMQAVSKAFFAPLTAPAEIRDKAVMVFPPAAEGGLAQALEYVRSLP